MKMLLTAENVSVSTEGKRIITKLNLQIQSGGLHVLMGPNGSGKSTLAYALLGHPKYTVRATKLQFAGRDIKPLTPDERARLGMFLGFQYPNAMAGISLSAIIPAALRTLHKRSTSAARDLDLTLAAKMAREQTSTLAQFQDGVADHLELLKLPKEMIYRDLNVGFSGGERKKAEVLQMLALRPKFAVLDEPDSGLDVDALKHIARAIETAHHNGTAILLITHYQRILKYLQPNKVHVMQGGTIVQSGGPELAREVERKGYEKMRQSAVDR